MAQVHRYQSHVVWRGSTAAGPAHYDRTHQAVAPPAKQELRLSADPAFRGDATLLNPEQLLLAAASSCQLLSFLALAARAGVDVVAYQDDADALMPVDERPARITQVVLRPQILVATGADLDQVRRLVTEAHDSCYIANSLTAKIVLEPSVEHVTETVPDVQPAGRTPRSVS